MENIIKQLRDELRKNAEESVKESGQRYFKEPVQLYGVKTALVSKIAKQFFRSLPETNKDIVFPLCETLWQSGLLEESFVACHWSEAVHKQYTVDDFATFDRWVRKYVNNWASCDTLCNHSIGSLIEKYPKTVQKLKPWTYAQNRWIKRASAVSLILPARRGQFLSDVFEIAETLLHDPDDLVQKGYGWMLKEASRKHQQEVFDFIQEHKKTMPRTALRYAIEKMPDDLRKIAMSL